MAAVGEHMALALVLTCALACQAGALAAVLRSRRLLASRRPPRITDLVWLAIPVAVVLCLAARSWMIALDLGSPAMAVVMRADAPGRRAAPPLAY